MKRKLSLFLALAVIILSFPACSKSSDTQKASSNDDGKPKFVNGKLTKEFHLKLPTFTGFNEFIIGDVKGFFKEVGIIPEYTGVLPQSTTLAQSVIKGDNHLFGSGHPTNIGLARKSGFKIKIVLESMIDDPDPDKLHMTWLVKSGGPIKSPKDLVGKNIAISNKGGCLELLNTELLRQNGISADKVKLLVMKDEQQEQALRQGLIDVAVVHPPYNRKARNAGGLDVLATSYEIGQKAGNGQLSGLAVRAFSEDFIKKYPDVVKAYIVADIKAQRWINEHYDEALKLESDFLKIDIKDMAGNVYPDRKWVQKEDIDFWIKLAEQDKLTGFETPGAVKSEDLFTNDLNPYYTGELKWPY